MSMTVTKVEIVQLEEMTLHHAVSRTAWATPLFGEKPRLPEQPTPASGKMVWRWPIRRKMFITHCRIILGERRLTFILNNPCHLRRGDQFEITASLHQLV